jgi:DNA-binding GntR family transcriptional regulator
MSEQRGVRRASTEHARILAAFGRRNLAAACASLKRNMESGGEVILAWLMERETR